MVSLANESIRGRLEDYPNSSWGFVIYRCTYSSDEEWEKYMAVLNAHVRAQLELEELSDCFDRIKWNVQEDPRYEGMNDHEVRVEFKKWIASGGEVNDGSARFLACLWVDEISMKNLTEFEGDVEKFDRHGVMNQCLVSVEEPEGPLDGLQQIALSYLLPRAYLLIEDPGWYIIVTEDGDVSMP